ncbi:hypothetical protein K9M47_01525 [Candidatus Gracilibacteria bacterium]|nr:hypothetical protein [Candidatus Gracilibacteria bacterium]
MTIAEIESTLHTLLTRHPNLDEGMLVTLLTASGWEDKTIKETVLLFKSENQKKQNNDTQTSILKVEPVLVLPKNESQISASENVVKISTTPLEEHVKPKTVPVVPTPPTPILNINTNTSTDNKTTNDSGIVYIDSEGKEEDILPNFVDNGAVLPKADEPQVTPIPPKVEINSMVQDLKKAEDVVPEKKEIIKTPEPAKTELIQSIKLDSASYTEPDKKEAFEIQRHTETKPSFLGMIFEKLFSKPHIDSTQEKKEIDQIKTLPEVESSDIKKQEIVPPDLIKDEKPTDLVQDMKLTSSDPQSLIVPKEAVRKDTTPTEPPENLPLKPFESTPHVWSFSKYKDVFHGSSIPFLSSKEQSLVDEYNGVDTEQVKEKIPQQNFSPQKHNGSKIKIKRTGFDGEDEGLIFFTGLMLFIILLLLSYMYSNGRI